MRLHPMVRGLTSLPSALGLVFLLGVSGCPKPKPKPKHEPPPPAGYVPATSPSGRARPVARVKPPEPVIPQTPPSSFKSRYSVTTDDKPGEGAFINLASVKSGFELGTGGVFKTPLGPLYRRSTVSLSPQWKLKQLEFTEGTQIAPKITLIRRYNVTFEVNQIRVRTTAFGYAWETIYPATGSADFIPMGRQMIPGAMILARRFPVKGSKTPLKFEGIDAVSGAIIPLTVNGRREGANLILDVLVGTDKSLMIVYDMVLGGISRIKDGNRSFLMSKTRVKVPEMPEDQAAPALVKPFVWPARVTTQRINIKTSDGKVLKGIISLPRGRARKLLVLVPAAGMLDRDGTQGMRRPYAELAYMLTVAGYAVLRYDKRGVGRSEGVFGDMDLATEISDLRSIIDFLLKERRFRKMKLFLLGHGEGGLVAAMAARNNRKIRGVACLSTPAVPYRQVIIGRYQRHFTQAGFSESVISQRLDYLKRQLDIIEKSPAAFGRKTWLGRGTAWLQQVMKLNLDAELKGVRASVLILYGSADVVVTKADSETLSKAFKKAKRVKVLPVVEGVGHFLQRSPNTPEIFPDEWTIPSPVDQRVFKAVSQWVGQVR